MGWSAPIDLYCERVGPQFWGEPLNAVSNAAFLIAGLSALRLWLQRGGGDRATLALAGLVLAMGFGSFVFHTYAKRWALIVEGAPIALFVHGYCYLALRRLLGLGMRPALLATLALAVATGGVAALAGDTLDRTLIYLPSLLALVACCAGLRWRIAQALARPDARVVRDVTAMRLITAAAAIFAAAMVAHAGDLDLCDRYPRGLHWLWHLLDAAVLYLLLRATIPHRAPAAGARP